MNLKGAIDGLIFNCAAVGRYVGMTLKFGYLGVSKHSISEVFSGHDIFI